MHIVVIIEQARQLVQTLFRPQLSLTFVQIIDPIGSQKVLYIEFQESLDP